MKRVNFEQTKCPAELTVKTGCIRNDESHLSSLNSPAPPFNPSSSSKSSSASPSTTLRLSTGSIAGISVAGVTFLATLVYVIYYILRRRSRAAGTKLLKEEKALSSNNIDVFEENEPLEPVGNDQGIQELYPVHIQEKDTTQIHQLNAVNSTEMDAVASKKAIVRGHKTPNANNLKLLPTLLVELGGSPRYLERSEGEWELDFIRSYEENSTP
ncbi:MAG: hypothetical protein Q9181_007529 [Wetmoreana brouardii]